MWNELPAVQTQISYLAPGNDSPQVRVYPPSSGQPTLRPASVRRLVSIHDARPLAHELRLDEHGFELRRGATAFTDFYDEAAVRGRYYPEVEALMQAAT